MGKPTVPNRRGRQVSDGHFFSGLTGKVQREGAKLRFIQDLLFLDGPVEIDGAPLARTVAEGVAVFPHFITGTPGEFIGGATFLLITVKNIPARGQDHQVAEAGQGKTPLVDQTVDLVYLGDVKGSIEAVVGILFPKRFDKPLFFIFPDTFLGQVHMAGDLIDQKKVTIACGLFVLSSGHIQFYKGFSLNKSYRKHPNLQEKFALQIFFIEAGSRVLGGRRCPPWF